MNLKKITPYLIAFFAFVIVALAYFYPVLEGKKIMQSDIVQFTGMSKEIQDYRAEYHTEPYWTDAAFSGMPAYQVSAYFPYDFIQKLDSFIRFLPRPADYLFLYFFGFFVLLSVLKTDWRLALIGALAFGFSTYLLVIIGVGHNAKAHAIGYFPLVLAGIWLVFRQQYLWGFVLTTLAAALEIATGHVQMTYYLFFVIVIFGLSEFIYTIKSKTWKPFFTALFILMIAGVLALGMNANHLLPTKEYAKESTRSKSELTLTPEGNPKDNTGGLDRSYITEYSYGVSETFNLFIPRFKGGGNAENVGTNSATYNLLKNKIGRAEAKAFVKHTPTYWGNQPIVAAPAYVGAVVIFLFVLAIFLVNNRLKYWILASVTLAVLLSWGKNFSFLTNFFIDYVPMYNKFRAVSSIQVIVEFLLPVLAVLGLHQFLFSNTIDDKIKEKSLLYTTYITGGVALFFLVLGRSWFSFESASDLQYDQMLPGFADALIQDRKTIFTIDTVRSLLLVIVSAGILFAYIKKKAGVLPIIVAIGVLVLIDGVGVAQRYVNSEDFQSAKNVEKPFEPTEADKIILKDTTRYRVINFTVNPLNDGSTSYFHKSLGGYHAAKPRRYQELFDYQITNNNFEILNMLNAKYWLYNDENGETFVQKNDSIYGNAWFAHKIQWVQNADEEIKALDSLSPEKAVIKNTDKQKLSIVDFQKDSTATIVLKESRPNRLVYTTTTLKPQLVLFSEMYYPYGWKATINGKPTSIFRANYVLRAIEVPAGNHEIIFSFEPEIVKKGAKVSLISSLIFITLTIIAIFLYLKKTNKYDKRDSN